MKIRSATLALAFAALAPLAVAQKLVLENPLAVDRPDEVFETPLSPVLTHLRVSGEQAHSLVAVNAVTGERIPVQIYASEPGKPADLLLLLVHLTPRGKLPISFRIDAAAAPLPAKVFGREAPERKDDFAWENELVAYRVYGPALQATGEIASGIDVWSKRVPNFVIDSFYKRDKAGFSYHKDDGIGLDSYYVGPTRGCGGTAVFEGNKLAVSKNYIKMHMIAGGPIRFAFEVSYAPWDAGGTSVVETKRIVLDAGTHLNRITSTYSFQGPSTLDLVAGIAIHDGATASIPVKDKIAAVWDTPQTASAGRITTGLIAAPGQQARTVQAASHALLEFTRRSGEPFTYYAGSGWSKADMPTPATWEEYLQKQLLLLEHPLKAQWIRR